jgi:high-affinity nickel-transport protein
MMFPALFTVGMAIVDTTDSILMLGAYGWIFMKPMRKLVYNITTITSISVLVAVLIGGIETLGLIRGEFNLSGPFWDKVSWLSDNSVFGLLGYGVVGIFIAAWIISITVYKFKHYDEIEVATAD